MWVRWVLAQRAQETEHKAMQRDTDILRLAQTRTDTHRHIDTVFLSLSMLWRASRSLDIQVFFTKI